MGVEVEGLAEVLSSILVSGSVAVGVLRSASEEPALVESLKNVSVLIPLDDETCIFHHVDNFQSSHTHDSYQLGDEDRIGCYKYKIQVCCRTGKLFLDGRIHILC